jgi:hypothetical protein
VLVETILTKLLLLTPYSLTFYSKFMCAFGAMLLAENPHAFPRSPFADVQRPGTFIRCPMQLAS